MVITSTHQWSSNTTHETRVHFNEHKILTTVTKDPDHVTSWISQTVNLNLPLLHGLLIGLDVEWRPCRQRGSENPVAIIQLCVNNRCLIFQILHSPTIPFSLVIFLNNPTYTFTGVGIRDDVEKLVRHYGLGLAANGLRLAGNVVDLGAMAVQVYKNVKAPGLKGLTRLVLGKVVEKPKRVTMSNWDDRSLSPEQVKYACVDAFLSFEIGRVLRSRCY